MKKLNLDQMELTQGGDNIEWACVGVGVVGIVSGFFTLGFGTALAIGMAGGVCTGYTVAGLLDKEDSGSGGHGASGTW